MIWETPTSLEPDVAEFQCVSLESNQEEHYFKVCADSDMYTPVFADLSREWPLIVGLKDRSLGDKWLLRGTNFLHELASIGHREVNLYAVASGMGLISLLIKARRFSMIQSICFFN